MLVIGSIIGVQLDKNLVKELIALDLELCLAILLLIVGIAIAYDTFFAEKFKKKLKLSNQI
jgi:uncharacterized membrane protein YfcA